MRPTQWFISAPARMTISRPGRLSANAGPCCSACSAQNFGRLPARKDAEVKQSQRPTFGKGSVPARRTLAGGVYEVRTAANTARPNRSMPEISSMRSSTSSYSSGVSSARKPSQARTRPITVTSCGIWNLFVEERSHDAAADFLAGRPVHQRITPRTRDLAGERPEPRRVVFEDVTLHETVEDELVDVVRTGRQAFYPESRVVLIGLFRNGLERWIEQFVPSGRRDPRRSTSPGPCRSGS